MKNINCTQYINIEYYNGIYCVCLSDSNILDMLSRIRFDDYYKLVGHYVGDYFKVARDKIEDCFSELKYRIHSVQEVLSRILEKRKATERITDRDEVVIIILQQSLSMLDDVKEELIFYENKILNIKLRKDKGTLCL